MHQPTSPDGHVYTLHDSVASHKQSHHPRTTEETILVVDDDLDIVELLKISLESDGFNVHTACDGASGLDAAWANVPDLVLLDVMMPHKDGFQVLKELREDARTKAVPVILLTARGQTEDKVRGLDTGADDYITKPFDLREVTARVEAVLGRTRPIRYINPLMKAMGDGFSEEGVEKLAGHLEAAAAIQRKLLPEKAPSLPGFDIATLLQSSTSVSGDFYDFIPLSEKHIGIVLGDVKGSGIPAALVMVMIRTALRLLCDEAMNRKTAFPYPEPAAILKRINDLLVRDTDVELFATMIYGVLDTADATFTYTNGGHCYPLHYKHRTGEIDFLEACGMLVGAFEEATFTTKTCTLAPGDILVAYTDGITEAEGPPDIFYGEERLAACLTKHAADGKLTPTVFCELVQNDLARFSGSTQPNDDRALVVIKHELRNKRFVPYSS